MIKIGTQRINKRPLLFLFSLSFAVYFLFSTMSSVKAGIFEHGAIHFKNVDLPDVKSIVSGVVESKDGFLWIATQGGLYRYDGYSTKHYTNDPDNENSVLGNHILQVFEASDGRIWIIAFDNGISAFDPQTETFTHYQHNPDDVNSISSNRVRAVAETANGDIWIGSWEGLNHLDIRTGIITRYKHISGSAYSINHNLVRSLTVDDNDNLWIGTWDGLNLLRSGSNRFESIAYETDNGKGLAGERIFTLHYEDQKLWIGTVSNSAVWIDTNTLELHRPIVPEHFKTEASNRWLTGFVSIDNNTMWASVHGLGILVIDIETGQLTDIIKPDNSNEKGLSGALVSGLYKDSSGLVWVRVWGQKLQLYNPQNKAFSVLKHVSYKDSIRESDVNASLELQSGELLISTSSFGIDVYSPEEDRFTFLPIESDNPDGFKGGTIVSMFQTDNGDVWIVTMLKGIYKLDPKTWQFTHFYLDLLKRDQVSMAVLENSQKIWLATNTGLVVFDIDSGEVKAVDKVEDSQEPFNTWVNSLKLDRQDNLWIGTNSGLFFKPQAETNIHQLNALDKGTERLLTASIRGLEIDNQGRLWVSAVSLGIYRLEQMKKSRVQFDLMFDSKDYPESQIVGSMIRDNQGRLWSSAMVLDPESQTLTPYDSDYGFNLGTPKLNVINKTKDGLLLFSGSSGLLMIKPDAFRKWQHQPKMVVREIAIDGVVQERRLEQLILQPDTKEIQVSFAALDFSNPAKLKYEYKLTGFNDNWLKAKTINPEVTYTNLDPGSYTLQIRATNRTGEWSPNEINLSVVQMSAWYETLMFRLMAILAFLVLLYSIFKYRLGSLETQKSSLSKAFDIKADEASNAAQLLAQKDKELQEALAEIERLSLTDKLTGAKNRRFMTQYLPKELAKLKRAKGDSATEQLGFMLINTDNFKRINDTHGHAAGDEVLVQTVNVINENVRQSDWVVRLGGNEFLVVSSFVDLRRFKILAERIRMGIQLHEFNLNDGLTLSQTCSMGLATWTVNPSFSVNEVESILLEICNRLLYRAKNHGHNQWISADVTDALAFRSANDMTSTMIEKLIESEEIELVTSVSS